MMLNKRQIEIIQNLLYVSVCGITQLAKLMQVSRQTIYEDLFYVEQWLNKHEVGTLQRSRKGVSIVRHTDRPNETIIFTLFSDNQWINITQPKQRQAFILFHILVKNDVTWEALSQELMISRGTLLNDLQEIRNALSLEHLDLIYDKMQYRFLGSELAIRSFCINFLAPYTLQLRHYIGTQDLFDAFFSQFKESSALALDVAQLALYIQDVRVKKGFFVDPIMDEEGWEEVEYLREKIGDFFLGLEGEDHYRTLLVGSFFRFPHQNSLPMLIQMSQKLVLAFRTIIHQQVMDERAVHWLEQHLKATYYRSMLGIVLENPLYEEIRERHAQPFALVRLILESYFHSDKLIEQEASYLTVLLLSLQSDAVESGQDKRILVLCYEGIAIAQMIKQQLQRIGLSSQAIVCGSLDASAEIEEYDLILSTVALPFSTTVKQLVVQPILSPQDLSRIVQLLDWQEILCGDFTQFQSFLKNYMGDSAYSKCLEHYITEYVVMEHVLKKPDKFTLRDLLPAEHIQIISTIPSWQEAIWQVAEPLLTRNLLSEQYVQESIEGVQKYGPYIVLKSGFALPHANYKHGEGKLSMSLLILETPVAFSYASDHQVSVLLMIVPEDENSHLEVLMEFIHKMDDDVWFNTLKNARSIDRVIDLFKEEG